MSEQTTSTTETGADTNEPTQPTGEQVEAAPSSPAPEPAKPETPNPVPAPPATDKTLTQAEVDRIVQQRLAREREKYADYDELNAKAAKATELESASQTEAERLAALANEIAELKKARELDQAERAAAQLELARTRIASEKGLTPAQAKWLRGDTAEEIATAAEELVESFGLNKPTDPEPEARQVQRPKERLRPGSTNPGDDNRTPAEIAAEIRRRRAGA